MKKGKKGTTKAAALAELAQLKFEVGHARKETLIPNQQP